MNVRQRRVPHVLRPRGAAAEQRLVGGAVEEQQVPLRVRHPARQHDQPLVGAPGGVLRVVVAGHVAPGAAHDGDRRAGVAGDPHDRRAELRVAPRLQVARLRHRRRRPRLQIRHQRARWTRR
jgi:hypothetical protein